MKRRKKLGKHPADAAFEKVVDVVIDRAERFGTKIAVWKDGQVQLLDPEEARLQKDVRAKNRKTG